MISFFKNIFKKSVNSHNWIPFLWSFFWNTTIQDNEYVKFFIGWQYAAITAIWDSISSLQYRVADEDDNDMESEYLDFISPDLLGSIATFMKLCWTAYVWKINLWWKVLWLSILLPWCIEPEIDSTGNLVCWKYYWWWNTIKLSVDEVLVFAEFNPYQRYPYITKWYSPLQAIAMTIKWEKEIETWNYSLLTHDVPPGMVLTTDQAMSSEQVKVIKESWEKNHSWAANVGKLAILPFWIKPAQIQASPKEMEFISQQNWDRDKILAIYKVPKAVLGIGEWVNVWNVKAFNQIFASRCIEPLAKKIARVFNDKLFNWIWTFEFLNILPTDEEEVRQHYLSWWITKNEYRIELWYKPIKWWDVFVDGSECKVDSILSSSNSLVSNNILTSINFKAIVKKHIPWSEEWMIERWNNKVIRLDAYQDSLKILLLKIFSKQEDDVIKLIDKKIKWYFTNRAFSLSSFLGKKYYSLYYVLLKEEVKKIILKEGNRALDEVNSDKEFNVNDPIIIEGIKELIMILAEQVDSITEERLKALVLEAINEWLSKEDIKNIVTKVFSDLKTTRLEKIIRTESVRYISYAEQKAWNYSWVVKYKQWWTALDERTCEECNRLHGKKVLLNDEFKKDVMGTPLHPNCRCDMIPVVG